MSLDTQTTSRRGLPWPFELEPAEVETRFRWARRRGHPRYVWPELPVGAWRAALRDLEAVVRAGLAGTPFRIGSREADAVAGGAGGAGGEGGDGAWARAVGIAAFTSGVGPLLGRWVEDGLVEAPEPVAGVLAAHLWHGRARAERQARDLERVVAALSADGIEPLVVKSGHVARVYYPEPGVRPAVDVDVVVEPGEQPRAEAALGRAGYTLAARQHRPPKSDWLPAGVEPYPRSLELLHAGSHYGVDLQTSLARNFFGVRTVRPAPVPVGRAATRPAPGLAGARVLEQPLLLAYQALHASEGLHSATLIRLVDLVLIARVDTARGALDWAALLALLEECGGTRFAYPALALAERLAPGTLPGTVLERLERAAPRRMRAVVGSVTPATAQRPEELSLRERFMWCVTPWEHARRLVHMAAPPPAGRSVRRLAGHYRERLYRLVRGRVRAGGSSSSKTGKRNGRVSE